MIAQALVATAATPLGADAYEPLDRDELMAAFEAACRLPVPDYAAEAMARLPPLEK